MDCGSCQNTPVFTRDDHISALAEKLAYLLVDLPEFQNYLRLARAVRMDADVRAIIDQINRYPYAVNQPKEEMVSIEALNQRLESMPVVQAYRSAENAVREYFQAVNAVISSAAGIDFAANARSGCG